jgi:hypothetical protein
MKRVSVAMMMSALLLLLAACDGEWSGRSSGKVSVRFAVSTDNAAGNDVVLRSGRVGQPAEEQMVSLGDDLFLYAALTPESTGAELRAFVPLSEGQKVRLSAYETGTSTLVDDVLYTNTGGELVSDDALMLEVGTYDFTAYSYYDSGETPGTTTIHPDKDLVWGQQLNKEISVDNQTVTIQMKHLFSKVRVNVKTEIENAAITALGVATITGSYADLSVYDGKLSKGADITHSVTFPDFTSMDSIVGNETHLVYPGVKVHVTSLTVAVPGMSGSPFTLNNLSLGFNNLEGGKRYLLSVSVRRRRWAWSNIYWQAVADVNDARYPGYMTFDTTDQGHQGYQGVHFSWGSLVGQMQVGYTPTYNTNDRLHSTWATGGSNSSLSGNDGYYAYDGTYLADPERNTVTMYGNRQGDICQYLGFTNSTLYGYRMPIGNEFPNSSINVNGSYLENWNATNTTIPTVAGWLRGPGSFIQGGSNYSYADGRADFLSSDNGAGQALGSASHPSTGLVLVAGGGVSYGFQVGWLGHYWTASPSASSRAWIMHFNDEIVGVATTYRSYTMPIRCIRKLPGEVEYVPGGSGGSE